MADIYTHREEFLKRTPKKLGFDFCMQFLGVMLMMMSKKNTKMAVIYTDGPVVRTCPECNDDGVLVSFLFVLIVF